ncbi:MAG: metal-dependent phosphohydrolase, sub domain, partial [Deltaproteobacteria bacterium]|nr:metal-dependent phosphohydrolase, sub domain [Deltaproteobacteria bacterium]
YYTLPIEERASAVSLGFPDIPECSTEVLDSLRKGEMVNLSKLKTLSDFKLLQLSWVYDLNFPISFRLVAERDYINRIADTLPKSDDISSVLNLIREFAEQRALR